MMLLPIHELITISIGQALVLLIDKHRNDSDKTLLSELKKLYFLGAKNTSDAARIETLIASENSLQEYKISKEAHDINDDPTRRYFETHLAYEIVKGNPFAAISLDDLKAHYDILEKMLPLAGPDGVVTKQLMTEIFSGNFTNVKKDLLNSKEYHDALLRVNSNEHFHFLSEYDREKMALIIKCSYICVSVPEANLPLNIYKEGYYLPANRGKVVKDEKEQSSTLSSHYGLMKSYMPVPSVDVVTSNKPFPYLRVPDRNNFNPESKWTIDNFKELVHPFSCSISGTMLLHHRVFRQLENEGQFVFRESKKFTQFLKAFISLMIYNSGGHSFHEFMYPLNLPALRENFNFISGFENINTQTLFLNGNDAAMDKALDSTIAYNKQILAKKAVNLAILENNSRLFTSKKESLSNEQTENASVNDHAKKAKLD